MSDEKKSNLQLLPKGAFIITQQDGQAIKGRFSMYVLDRFCEAKKIPDYLTLLQKIIVGMSVGDYADLIQMAIDDYFRNQPDGSGKKRVDIMDLIDNELDGISSDDFNNLLQHAIGRVGDVKKINTAIKDAVATEEEKKSLTSSSTDTGSGSDATKAD